METLEDGYLKFHADTMMIVRKAYNLDTPGRMEDAINILEEWIKKQDHFLKKDFSRDYLERLIIGNKGLIERTKTKLDNLCTLRTIMPEFAIPCNVKDFDNINKCIDAVMPKLMPNYERVYLLKVNKQKYTPQMHTNYYKRTVVYWEYYSANDYCCGYHTVVDFRNINILDLISTANLTETHRFSILGLNGYSNRTKGFHLITSSKLADVLISVFKKVIPLKFHDRIKHHIDLESLHKEIPREILPADYGGSEKPLHELNEDFLNEVSSKEHRAHMEAMYEARVDESKRPLDKFNEHYLGTPGTFRNLVVD